MHAAIYISFAVLVLAIVYTIFRILRLFDIVRGRKEEDISVFGGRLQALLLLGTLFGGLGWFLYYGVTRAELYQLAAAAAHAEGVDNMLWIMITITLIILFLTHFLLFFFGYLYHYRKGRKVSFFHDNDRLEIIWTVIPGLVLVGLLFQGWLNWVEITAPAPKEAETIEVVGYQFAWSVRYSGKDKVLGAADYRLIDAENRTGVDFSDVHAMDDFMPRELHLPKGRPIQFNIRGLDVIHSFYAPHFRMQMYAVPGMPTTFWITPTKTTQEMRNELKDPEFNYEIACNKICGKGHFAMRYIIVVDEPEDYDEWRQSQESWISKHPDYLQQLRAQSPQQPFNRKKAFTLSN